jgi:hypothetical protein
MSRKLLITSFASLFVASALICGVVFAGDSGSGGPDPNLTRPHRIPVLKYAVASPRACLIGPPRWSTDVRYLPSGDADNFPRANGGIRIRVGTRVVFCLSRDLEGVWYTGSYGCMGTSIVLQSCRFCECNRPDPNGCDPDPNNCNPDPNCPYARCVCERCRELGAVCCPLPDDPVIEPCPWVTIGRDGAKACRKGPSIGRAKVGVPVTFRRPGFYLLRAIVHTFAKPGYPLPLDQWRDRLVNPDDPSAVLPEPPVAQDRDVIYIRVRVYDFPVPDTEPDDDITEDPDVVFIRPIPKEIDPNDEPIGELDSDLNGDEIVNLADLAIMAQQWGRQYEMPFTDDE